MTTIRLYDYWRSSAAYRIRIALNLKGLNYESIPVSLLPEDAEDRSPEYRAINPQGLVPFFDDGAVAFGQSMAIIEYLEEKYPAVPLLPLQPEARALVRSFCQSIICDIHPLNNSRVMAYLEQELDVAEPARMDWYSHWIHEGFRSAEEFVGQYSSQQRFVFDNAVSFADCCLVPQVYNARRFGVALDSFPRLIRIAEHCETIAEFRQASPADPALNSPGA